MATERSSRARNKPGASARRGSKARGRGGSAASARRAIRGARGTRGRWVRTVLPIVAVIVVAVGVVVGVELSGHSQPAAATGTSTSGAILAPATGQSTGDTVDGVESSGSEQVLFHIHAHLAIYVNGKPELLPYGIGIVPPYQLEQTASGPFVAGGAKFYWLHTHDETGVIHIESPVQRTFTLGDFFDIWRQPLGADQVGPATGTVIAFLNGQKFSGNPRDLPLTAHAVLQLDVGTVVPAQPYTFPSGL